MTSILPFPDSGQPDRRPTLPVPTRERWQPLRLGLVEMFHYDSEEFWFRDGHLLLRGNNGTGKSKVLSLTLPFLLDAQLKPSRIEPDGDGGKRMSWNLLMNSHDRRTGYVWIEFGRLAEDGTPHYLTLGAGLAAAAARPQVDCWYFIVDDRAQGPRINRDLWLTNSQRVVLGRERLREALAGSGQIYDTARSYRRAVDERLFRLGGQRYDALMDTLIQLRQPQLSKQPDESKLSNALTEALPPLPPELIADVAEALGQLEEDRRQLEEYQDLAKAVERFERRYRVYAGTRSRREAQVLRNAQTDFDSASRLRNDTTSALDQATTAEGGAINAESAAEVVLRRERARLETLRSDPRNQDANRLENSAKDAEARRRAHTDAGAAVAKSKTRLQRDMDATRQLANRVTGIGARLSGARRESATHAGVAGIASVFAENALTTLDLEPLADLSAPAFERASGSLRKLATDRREQTTLVRRRHGELSAAEAMLAQRRESRDERSAAAKDAVAQRDRADAAVETRSEKLLETWGQHFAGLKQLKVSAADVDVTLAQLADWVRQLKGDNPANLLLHRAQQSFSIDSARRRVALEAAAIGLKADRAALIDEQSRLESGVDAGPQVPHTRDPLSRSARDGAALWQLVDFADWVTPTQRAGLEAALEGSGLLDAWISPDGRLQTGDGGRVLLDTQVLEQRQGNPSLAVWLQPAVPTACPVAADIVTRVLDGIACTDTDRTNCSAWLAPDGRFRLGTLAGAWAKAEAVHIGFAARAAARARRLAAIAERLLVLAGEIARIEADTRQLEQELQRAADEWRTAPSADDLRTTHLEALARARDAQLAHDRLADADTRFADADRAMRAIRDQLMTDAGDLRLPFTLDALAVVETALDLYNDAQAQLRLTASELRHAVAELKQRREREAEARDALLDGEVHLARARIEAEEANTRLDVLRGSIGAKVEELMQQLAETSRTVDDRETTLKQAGEVVRQLAEQRAVAAEKAAVAKADFEQRRVARSQAVEKFQRFAATGLLLAGWPEAEMPDLDTPWTIDPALTLARRAEQVLSEIRCDDEAWARVQRDVQGDLTELQRALSARGHQAQGSSTDWGLVVHVIYQNRPERPDRLLVRLADEISQRNELLTAKEREVLENHLESEIAAEIQRLLQAADVQRNAVNKELYSRPTSTGVRFRLQWQPLAEDEGAPVGLEEARKRLLNKKADLWSVEDRRIVGAMLQSRIAAERERADSATEGRGGGTLGEQLTRALDYRRWHRFRVERWQDGTWRRLSGPASSGERALGLTVPLFAAVASFYTKSNYPLAPRLMLLDEAFAGIDDAARAHCMGLIREFDLDFVITSEREWACYAELPGVSICQLQRKEGIDAVFVSRWTWDGRAKAQVPDPDRRFAPA